MNIQMVDIDRVIPYANNPRKNDNSVEKVAASIKEFGFQQPIVVDKDMVVIAGHTRLKGAKKLKLKEVPVVVADNLTEEQVKAYRLADNKVGEESEWDDDLLQLELGDIININMEDFGFLEEEPVKNYDDARNEKNLSETFLVPPFSIFDTRAGYWQDRKREWKSVGIKSDVGRNDSLLGDGLNALNEATGSSLTGTSIFDPVLCEVCYKWFNVDNGKIFDCFAGGPARGIVASMLGYDYVGIDLRKEQIDANYENASELNLTEHAPIWYCDDSLNVDNYVEDESVDMLFSCPPYADLEVYSNDERDISNMEYADFVKVYTEIIKRALRKLKKDRFAVFVVGDVRNNKGYYRDFISHTKKAFIENGAQLYNEIILLEAVGTAALRARRLFTSSRKVVKTNQNVLVFYKGDAKKIKDNFKEIEIAEIDVDDSTD